MSSPAAEPLRILGDTCTRCGAIRPRWLGSAHTCKKIGSAIIVGPSVHHVADEDDLDWFIS